MAVHSKNKQLQQVEIAISVEKQPYLLDFVPCLCQIEANAKFSQCAIGLTKKEFLLYSDMGPNRIMDNVYFYNAFATLPIADVVTLVKSEMRRNEELRNYTRLDIFMKDINQSKILYFTKNDRNKLFRFLKTAKQQKIKLVNNVVDYSLGSR
ncbi:MAG: hypothetical protein J6T15_07175 [Bacilli bacterium]|nr:hypothetical protein [Bacilli bacterium]